MSRYRAITCRLLGMRVPFKVFVWLLFMVGVQSATLISAMCLCAACMPMQLFTGYLSHLQACRHAICLLCRFWETLVEGALLQQDKDTAFEWFFNVLQDTQSISTEHTWAIIDRDSSQLLLTEKMARLDPSTISEMGYRCFASYFNAVSSFSSLNCW